MVPTVCTVATLVRPWLRLLAGLIRACGTPSDVLGLARDWTLLGLLVYEESVHGPGDYWVLARRCWAKGHVYKVFYDSRAAYSPDEGPEGPPPGPPSLTGTSGPTAAAPHQGVLT